MKHIKLYENFLNEGKVLWDAEVSKPFNDKKEESAANNFSLEIKPVVVSSVEGYISDEEIEITVLFSNTDTIEFTSDDNSAIVKSDGKTIDLSKHLSGYRGSKGTATGDICLLYMDYKLGKIK